MYIYVGEYVICTLTISYFFLAPSFTRSRLTLITCVILECKVNRVEIVPTVLFCAASLSIFRNLGLSYTGFMIVFFKRYKHIFSMFAQYYVITFT